MKAPSTSTPLRTDNHRRDSAGLMYVYPVLSRRAGGVSLGINLNPNRACNWHCAYCQVEGLVRGAAPAVDLGTLETEFRTFISGLPEYMQRCVPKGARDLKDVAFSGNGEPTSSPHFFESVRLIMRILEEQGLLGKIPIRLITNGSLFHQERNKEALRKLSEKKGEVWFKIDTVLEEEIERINGTKLKPKRILENLKISTSLCPTWIQTCLVTWDGQPPSPETLGAYTEFLKTALEEGADIQGVFLYSLAREAMQEESHHVGGVDSKTLETWANRVRALGLECRVTA